MKNDQVLFASAFSKMAAIQETLLDIKTLPCRLFIWENQSIVCETITISFVREGNSRFIKVRFGKKRDQWFMQNFSTDLDLLDTNNIIITSDDVKKAFARWSREEVVSL